MTSRTRSRTASEGRAPSCAIDIVCVTVSSRSLLVLLRAGAAAHSWRLPGAAWRPPGNVDDAAAAITRSLFVRDAWHEQVGASSAGQHPERASLSLVFLMIVARGTPAPPGMAWRDVADLPANFPARHKSAIAAATAHLGRRMDQVPIAFRLLPPTFTLGDLQQVYELLVGRRLHKASFRRALHAAHLVEPTDEWRSEGRGRPAQFFRYAPRKRRARRHAIRFEMPGA